MAENGSVGLAKNADKSVIGDPARFQEKLVASKAAYAKDQIVKTWTKIITYGEGKEKGIEYTQYKNGVVKSRLGWLAKNGVVKRGNKPGHKTESQPKEE